MKQSRQIREETTRNLCWFLRRCKYYVVINSFICLVALTSYQLVTFFRGNVAWISLYAAVLMRITAMVLWFEWIATIKEKIYGDKRIELTPFERRSIYYRILYVVIPSECVSFSIAQWLTTPSIVSMSSFLMEFLFFIPESLVFEIIFDFFHYVAHWICHKVKWIYMHVHKRHHFHLHPCPLSTYEQDGIDLCLTNVLPLILGISIGFQFSTLQLHLLFAYKTYVEVAGHSGLEIKGFSFPQMPLVNVFGFCLRVQDHDLHHTHPRWNFAKRFSLWDRLFGTFRSPSTSQQ
jgi:sterol desaturase/sphingolipid hydroxylase (fatty acid hydroxylase superfamily)